jgi:hypothetical protein
MSLKALPRFLLKLSFLLPVLLIISCGGSGGGSGGISGVDIDDSNENDESNKRSELASRTIGVAPLAVSFDAIDAPGVMQPPEVNGRKEYADQHYQWDFGDDDSKVWVVSGKSKNRATGYVSAHVYEVPGIYTVNLTVTNLDGIVENHQVEIEVQDPDVIFAGTDTICMSTGSDFTGCPSGAKTVSTNNFSDIKDHIAANRRILLRRGDSWSTADSIRLGTADPLSIGAFGTCQNPDLRGICANAPLIKSTSTSAPPIFELGSTKDTRLMDLHMIDDASRDTGGGGASEMNQLLIFRLKVSGFDYPLSITHWDTGGHDQVMLVENDFSQGRKYAVYIGSKQLALMGNRLVDSDASHVIRIWHARKAYIANNEISGSSIASDSGRHALKLHGPDEKWLVGADSTVDVKERLGTRTRYVVISDNIFGSSGPWPVAVGPHNAQKDERLEDIVVEKNRFFSSYGTPSCCSLPVSVGLILWARYVTVRNNIFYGENSGNNYSGISISQRGIEPAPLGTRILNNTIYKMDTISGKNGKYIGVAVGDTVKGTIVRNNLVQFTTVDTNTRVIVGGNTDVSQDHNLLTGNAGLIDPENSDHLQKDFGLSQNSPAHNQGTIVPVFEGFAGNVRPLGRPYDLGAFERAE